MTMWPRPFCSTEIPQSKVLAYHQYNSFSTADSLIPFLHSQSSTKKKSFQIVNTESGLMDQEGSAISFENVKSRLHPPQYQVQYLN